MHRIMRTVLGVLISVASYPLWLIALCQTPLHNGSDVPPQQIFLVSLLLAGPTGWAIIRFFAWVGKQGS